MRSIVRLVTFVIPLVTCFSTAVEAQSCKGTALNTVHQAQARMAVGNKNIARDLLEQASRQCPTSGDVAAAVSQTYSLLGDEFHAKLYRDQAVRLGAKVVDLKPANPSFSDALDEKGYVREKWALVVGISEFKNPTYNLRYAAKDAKDFATMLADPEIGRFRNDGQHIKLLTNSEATVEGIKTAINDIARDSREEDLVVLYFSSHGTSADRDIATEKGQSGYIVAYNTDINNLYATAFSMEDMAKAVDTRIKAQRVVALMDTCYSGDAIRKVEGGKALEIGIPERSIVSIAQGKGRVVISSSKNTERSWESETYQNSYFMHFIIDGMKSKSGLLDVTDLFTFLQNKVPTAVMSEKKAPQHPIMWPEGRRVSIVIGTAVQ